MSFNLKLLTSIGWGAFFHQQLTEENWNKSTPMRVMSIHRGQLILSNGEKELSINLKGKIRTDDRIAQATVGDWVLLSRSEGVFEKVLQRKNIFKRKAAGHANVHQMVAANIDTIFIVTSCNDDFNLSRLERYLALAYDAKVDPVIILTKMDLADDPSNYAKHIRNMDPRIAVEVVNAKDPESLNGLRVWCKPSQTIAFMGSSGVGKSTLVNSLGAATQKTGYIREGDGKGRHTTTNRSLLPLKDGSILLDSPGLRELQIFDCKVGLTATFSDIEDLSQSCHFKDCHHNGEPNCAVEAAIINGSLEPRRLKNFNKLMAEQRHNTATIFEKRKVDKNFGKLSQYAIGAKKGKQRF